MASAAAAAGKLFDSPPAADLRCSPRVMLTPTERAQLNPFLERHKSEALAASSPLPHELVLNHNFPTVSSRYQQKADAQQHQRRQATPNADGVISPGRSDPVLSNSAATRFTQPAATLTTSTAAAVLLSPPPSMRLFPQVTSRYLSDPRLSPRLFESVRRETHSNSPAPQRGRSATPSLPRRSRSGSANRPATPPPFRSGSRPATPAEIRQRNQTLLRSAERCCSPSLRECVSVVRRYVESTPIASQRHPQRDSSPGGGQRAASPQINRARSPAPQKATLRETESYLRDFLESARHAVVPRDHVPRVATLSLYYQSQLREAQPPIVRWTGTRTPPGALRQ